MNTHKLALQMQLQKEIDDYLKLIDELVLADVFTINEFRFSNCLFIRIEAHTWEIRYLDLQDQYEVQYIPPYQDEKKMKIHTFNNENSARDHLTRDIKQFVEDMINPDTYLALKDKARQLRDYGYTVHFDFNTQTLHATRAKGHGRVDFSISKKEMRQMIDFSPIKDLGAALESTEVLFDQMGDIEKEDGSRVK